MGSYTWRLHLVTAFLGVYTRYLLLGLSRIAGTITRFLATGWRPVLLWLILSAEVAAIWEIFNSIKSGSAVSLETVITTEVVITAIGIFLVGLIIHEGWKARHRVVIDAFSDFSAADPTGNAKKPGLSNLLVIELKRLRDLYEDVDERRPISSLGGRQSFLDYAIKVDDSGESLMGALSTSTSFSLGPFTVPIGALAGIVGYIVQGPRITSGFHKDGDLYSLSAQMSGKMAKSWRVEGRLASEGDPPTNESIQDGFIQHHKDGRVMLAREKDGSVKNIDPMIRELACRIFTDCTTGGSTRWRATYAFNEGIWEYRKTIYSNKDWLRNLKNAERWFLEAISDDNYFDLAYYNLGVVYTELYKEKRGKELAQREPAQKELARREPAQKELARREPAQKAFLSAVRHNPERWQSYFSLALNRFETGTDRRKYSRGLIADVILHCNQALALCKGNAKIHDLLGLCHRLLAAQAESSLIKEHFIISAEHHAIATRNAWNTICAEEFSIGKERSEMLNDSRKTCWITLWDQAQNLSMPARCPDPAFRHDIIPGFWEDFSLFTAERILIQARFINRSNATIERELGDIYFRMGNYKKARHSFEAACRIEPANLQNWFLLALSCQMSPGKLFYDEMEMALKKVMTNPTEWYHEVPPRWKKKVNELPEEGIAGRMHEILDFFEREASMKDGEKASMEDRRYRIFYFYDLARKNKEYPEKFSETENYFKQSIAACNENEAWEKGIIKSELAALYDSNGMYQDANREYEESINYLQEDHPGEIAKRQIEYKYVLSLLQKDKIKALEVANRAYTQNPIGYFQLSALGDCWVQNRDYLKAQSVFESALLLRPEEIDMLIKIGNGYWNMGWYCKEIAEKVKYWHKAIAYLENILPLIDQSDVRTKLTLSHILGDCYLACAEYSKALYHLEIAAAMSTDYYEMSLIYLNQAYAYLYKREHDQSENYFSSIIDGIQQNMAPDQKETKDTGNSKPPGYPGAGGLTPGDPVDQALKEAPEHIKVYLSTPIDPFGEGLRIGYLYIRALLGKAYSLAERDAGLDKDTPESTVFLKRAEMVYSIIAEKYPDKSIEGEIADRRGWIKYKQENLDEAEKDIRRAIALKADPEYHLHLAYIYSSKSAETKDLEAKNLLTRKAIAQCTHAIDMATNKDMETRATKLKNDLLSKSPSSNT